MFVEINEYSYNEYHSGNMSEDDAERVYLGKCIINTDFIRYIHVSNWRWKNKEVSLDIVPNSIKYIVIYEPDRYVYTDIESYNMLKEILTKETKTENVI